MSNATLEAAGGEPAKGFFRGAPDLAIEIESPNDRKPHIGRRALEYIDAGAKLVWTTHPKTHTAIVYRPDGPTRLLRSDDVLDGEAMLPGFRIKLADVFA